MARLSFRCDEELVARVDEARGLIPRETWLRNITEQALLREQPTMFVERQSAWQELPEEVKPHRRQPGPNVENIRSSSQSKRDVSPRPKKAKP